MRPVTTLIAACVLSMATAFGVASCATVIGLDQVNRVDCTDDCGVDGSLGDDGGVPADGTAAGDGTPADGASTCPLGQSCDDGGRCDDAGVCRHGCFSNADCAAPNPVCDTTTSVCVPCLPTSNTCPKGTICVPLNNEYTCTQGCNVTADCTQADAGGDGGAATLACCNMACTNTASDPAHCGGCMTKCNGATATCNNSTCAYTVGGMLAGLPAATSVVLQNNGGDNLTLNANGAFTFATHVDTGSGYKVTVNTTPPGQICNVTNGMGTIAGAAVTTVQVTCMSCYMPGNQAFGFTGGAQSWTVPCGVTSVSLTVGGAAGAINAGGDIAGGLGGSATGTLSVSAGQVLQIFVGGAGSGTSGGWNGGGAGGVAAGAGCSGGGGGGASDVRTSPYGLADRVIVAGGGGGGGGDRRATLGPGGGGGGGGGYFGGGGGESYGGNGGGGGAAAAGGAGGCGAECSGAGGACGIAGSQGSGGSGAAVIANNQTATQLGGGGGAGGGLTAGTGATGGPCVTNFAGGGGGGGSAYVGGVSGGTTSSGVQAGNGQVTLKW
jgi:hypothetical protein